MVFHCQPWLTMVDCDATVVSDHGPICPLTMVHGQPWSENVIVIKLKELVFIRVLEVFTND